MPGSAAEPAMQEHRAVSANVLATPHVFRPRGPRPNELLALSLLFSIRLVYYLSWSTQLRWNLEPIGSYSVLGVT